MKWSLMTLQSHNVAQKTEVRSYQYSESRIINIFKIKFCIWNDFQELTIMLIDRIINQKMDQDTSPQTVCDIRAQLYKRNSNRVLASTTEAEAKS